MKIVFTKMDNGFLEALYSGEMDLSCCDMRILLCILRNTVGYQKKSLSISAKEIAERTNMTQRQAQKAIAKLCGRGFLRLISTKSKANTYEIDKAEFTSAASYEQKFVCDMNYSSQEIRTKVHKDYKPEFVKDTNYSSQDTIIKKNKRNSLKESGERELFIPIWFVDVWSEYPQRVGKGKLTTEDFIELDKHGLSSVMHAVERYKRDHEEQGKSFWHDRNNFFKRDGIYVDYLDENYTGEPLENDENVYDTNGEVFEK